MGTLRRGANRKGIEMSTFGKWLRWSLGPLQGLLPGLSSYRFFTALENNPKKAIRILTRKRSLLPLQQMETGLSPLHLAASKGQVDMVKAVLARSDKQYYIDLQNNNRLWTPLHCAVRVGNLEATKLLLEAKANAHLRNMEGLSVVHIAAGHGLLDIVKLLVSHGMLVDEADSKNNWTPLHYAAMQGHVDLVQWLVYNGARPGSVDKSNFTPMMLAALHGRVSCFHYLFPFRDSHKSKSKLKLIHLAAQTPTSEILSFLHSKGYDILETDNKETEAQAIHYAAYGKSTENLKFLLEHGVDVNTTDKSGSTALHIAVINQDEQSVRLLCDSGADADIENEKSLTPFDIAESLKNTQLIALLRRAKASNR